MFTPVEIRSRLREQPFVPLRIVTSSGQSYDVAHPDLVLVGHRALIVGVPSNDNPTYFESANRVAILLVTDLQDLPVAPPAGLNGSA